MKIGRQAGREMESSGKPRPASPCECSLPTRHSLALTPTDPAEEATTFLIANPRLKFSLNHRKHSHLQISNREPMRVFQLLPTHHSPEPLTCPETDHGRRRVTAFLIGDSAIRNPNNMPLCSKIQISNRQRNRQKCLSCDHAFRPQHLVSSTRQPAQPASFHRAASSYPRIQNNLQYETQPKEHAWPPQ